jgi:hypothetical protein
MTLFAFKVLGKSARVVMETFQKFYIERWYPTELLSDRDGEFVLMNQFVSLHRRIAAYGPLSNSRLEREHREIGSLC